MKKKTIISGTDLPYFFKLERRGKNLYYFGARHSFNPAHPQFHILTKRWNEFMKHTKGENCLALVEGGLRPVAKSAAESIRKGGEAHFITFLASRNGVETYCPEPSLTRERDELLKKFEKKEIQYYYFARAVSQWHRSGKRIPLPSYILPFLRRDKRVSQWPDFDFSFKHMKAIHQLLFRGKFEEQNESFFAAITDPTLSTTIINRVAASSSAFRDRYIVREIKKLWRKRHLFIAYGRSHALTHEPLL